MKRAFLLVLMIASAWAEGPDRVAEEMKKDEVSKNPDSVKVDERIPIRTDQLRAQLTDASPVPDSEAAVKPTTAANPDPVKDAPKQSDTPPASGSIATSLKAWNHAKEPEDQAKRDWGYKGEVGPDRWSSLREEYQMCKNGRHQSPINIVTASTLNNDKHTMNPLMFNYLNTNARVVNAEESSGTVATRKIHDVVQYDGHSFTLNYEPGSSLSNSLTGSRMPVKSFTFHSPSEHTVNGQSFEMEMQIVHTTNSGATAIVSIFYIIGRDNDFLNSIHWEALPSAQSGVATISNEVNLLGALPFNKHYWMYTGSMTTPPCNEAVSWYLMQTPVEMSLRQLERLQQALGSKNVRPVQKMNDRRILSSTRTSDTIAPYFQFIELAGSFAKEERFEQVEQVPDFSLLQQTPAPAPAPAAAAAAAAAAKTPKGKLGQAQAKKVSDDEKAVAGKNIPKNCGCYYTKTEPCPCARRIPTYILPTIPELRNRTLTGLAALNAKLAELAKAADSPAKCDDCPKIILKNRVIPSLYPEGHVAPCDCAIQVRGVWVAIQKPCDCMPKNPPKKDYVMPTYYPKQAPAEPARMRICGDKLNPCPPGVAADQPIHTVSLKEWVKSKGMTWDEYVKQQLETDAIIKDPQAKQVSLTPDAPKQPAAGEAKILTTAKPAAAKPVAAPAAPAAKK